MSNNSKNHDSVRESYLTVDVSVILEAEHTLSAFKFLKKMAFKFDIDQLQRNSFTDETHSNCNDSNQHRVALFIC